MAKARGKKWNESITTRLKPGEDWKAMGMGVGKAFGYSFGCLLTCLGFPYSVPFIQISAQPVCLDDEISDTPHQDLMIAFFPTYLPT